MNEDRPVRLPLCQLGFVVFRDDRMPSLLPKQQCQYTEGTV